ncbi:hypothetical protein RSOL_458590 [Rhizoctonia solani AG-3 Rhs1AP]|uniref:Uncharacterized protein n=1 Tax=Rhizoctonia solani AG-3 Rhs1AP TaxID=1086054 RepID=X8JHW3_9AGAM|nr:hypothetical protein RSOL_458590 [Rhizoctonia solani AG-3 Rhs1AP]
MNDADLDIFAQGAAGLALAAGALAEAAQSLSEAAAALSAFSIASQDDESPSTAYQSCESNTHVSESQETVNENGQDQEGDDDGSSVGANTGNNAYPRDVTPETPVDKDLRNPLPHPRDPAPAEDHSDSQDKPSGAQKQLGIDSLGELLPSGCFYLILEEEFDALPLILAYATAGKRTVCYLPTSGSLFPWESIVSAVIPDRQVRSAIGFSVNTIAQLSDVVDYFGSSSDGSVLVLRPTYLPRVHQSKAHSMCNSLIFWGLPGAKFWPDVLEALKQSPHTLFILGIREYLDSTCQGFITKLGSSLKAHPRSSALDSFEPGSFLATFRENVQRTMSRAQHTQNIQTIYEELLELPINDTTHVGFVTQSREERIDVVNKFVARVFLRGRTQYGSARFPVNGQGLLISDKAHRRLGTVFNKPSQPNQPSQPSQPSKATPASIGTNVKPTPIPRPLTETVVDNTPPKPTFTFTPRPGQWHIILQQDADAIPLICYLAHQHPKSLCSISHTHTAYVYGELFKKISTYEVTATSKKPRTIEEGLQRFCNVRLQSGLCLLRGNPPTVPDTSPNFERVKADALIYWGFPSSNSFLWPRPTFQDQFTHIYLIIPPNRSSTAGSPTLFREHPDSAMFNAQDDDSTLHQFREKAKTALGSMTHGELKQIIQFYFPAHPPAYLTAEFIGKVMMRDDYF